MNGLRLILIIIPFFILCSALKIMMIDASILKGKLEISKTEIDELMSKNDNLVCQLEEKKDKVIFIPLKSEVILMAKTITSEAIGEPIEGKIAVGEVILNRLGRGISKKAAKRHGRTLYDVIHRPGQFDGVTTKYFYRNPTDEAILAAILSYYTNILPKTSYHFANENTATDVSFVKKMNPHVFKKIGQHTFYNYKLW